VRVALANPYTPSARPRIFVGREQERERLRDRLARVAAYGEMMGPLTIVTGPRGVGKTSLLRDVASQAERDGFVVAWSACVKQRTFLAEVMGSVTRALERAEAITTPAGHASKVTVELRAGLARIATEFTRAQTSPGGRIGPLQDFFESASTLVRGRGGAGLVVMIDELHAPLESGSDWGYQPDADAATEAAVLLNVVQQMEAERERFPLGIVGAGLPQTKGLLTRAATFGERSLEITLADLDDATSAHVLTAPAAVMDVRWAPDALAEAVTTAQGYPQSLQVLGSATWEAARPTAGATLTLADFRAGLEQAERDLASMFEARWSVTTPAERTFLAAMAGLGDGPIRRRNLAEALGVTTTALSIPRQKLIDKGVIEEAGRGLLRFTVPGFGEFVRRREGVS
jgi:hypothetical protein